MCRLVILTIIFIANPLLWLIVWMCWKVEPAQPAGRSRCTLCEEKTSINTMAATVLTVSLLLLVAFVLVAPA